MSNERYVLWPIGDPDVQSPLFAPVISLNVYDNLTIVNMPGLTANTTIDLVIDPEIREGARLLINVDQDATGRDVALGNGFLGDGLIGVPNDRDTIEAVYNKEDGAFRVTNIHKTTDAA